MVHPKHHYNIAVLVLLGIILLFAMLVFSLYANNGKESDSYLTHANDDFKILFNYPKDWYIDEKNFDILISSYPTYIGENSKPSLDQIKISIDGFSGCHPTIEENLKDPACGEGGPGVSLNEILSKDMRITEGGTFYKYVILTPNGEEFTFYILENEDTVLSISKQPDPSLHEEEFEKIVNSIRFL